MEVSTLETEMRDAKEEIEIEGRLIYDVCELTDAVSGIAVAWRLRQPLSPRQHEGTLIEREVGWAAWSV